MSLRTRLVALVAILVACAAGVSGLLSYAATRDEAFATLDRFLDDRSARVAVPPDGLPPFGPDRDASVPPPPAPPPPLPPPPLPASGAVLGTDGRPIPAPPVEAFVDDDSVFGIIAPTGEVILSSGENVAELASAPDDLVVGLPIFDTVTTTDDRFRVRTELLVDGSRIVSARSTMETESTLSGVRTRLVVIVVLVTAIAGLVAWFAANLLARPLRRLNDAATEVASTGSLDTEFDTDASGEVGELAQSFTSMMSALRASHDEQQRLISHASHEFRTPLTTVRANVDMLLGGKLDPDDRATALRLIQSEVDELTTLVGELTELTSRPGREPDLGEVDMHELVGRAVERESARHGRTIDVAAPRHRPIHVVGDAAALDRAVSNLVGNAVKFSEPGTPILIRLEPGRLTVVDRGVGIPPGDLDTIFERFHRADDARSLPGSGLGLSIVRETARAHGGDAFARNHPNGATVGFTFS